MNDVHINHIEIIYEGLLSVSYSEGNQWARKEFGIGSCSVNPSLSFPILSTYSVTLSSNHLSNLSIDSSSLLTLCPRRCAGRDIYY